MSALTRAEMEKALGPAAEYTDLDALLADAEDAKPSYTGAGFRPIPHRHKWIVVTGIGPLLGQAKCLRCDTVRDDVRSKRGKNARSRGNALERWANTLLGISNRGKYGGPEDGGGEADWISVQTKSGSYYPKNIDRWLRAVPQRAGQMRGVVLVETPGAGQKRRALLVVDLYEAAEQWGNR